MAILFCLFYFIFYFDYSISLVTNCFIILFCIAYYHRYFWSGSFNKEVKICYIKPDSIVSQIVYNNQYNIYNISQ